MIKYTDEEIEEVFGLVKGISDVLEEDKYVPITSDLITDNGEVDELFAPLVGYEVKFNRNGDHRTDGQMVDYFFYFKSPEGKVTVIETEMCLMVGWNHGSDEIIN
jgi:hypothetical protein